ncbi:hypothetical protein SVAN01_04710 [Stagonosporopsis vannaccii]|nr:hypothetical protein SVAN01_04710 [Stagonosporopsis vannaccii]
MFRRALAYAQARSHPFPGPSAQRPASPLGPCHALPRIITHIVKSTSYQSLSSPLNYSLADSQPYQQTLPLPPALPSSFSFNLSHTQWPLPFTMSPTWRTTTSLLARDPHQPVLCLRFLPNKPTPGLSLHVRPFNRNGCGASNIDIRTPSIRLPLHVTALHAPLDSKRTLPFTGVRPSCKRLPD